MPASLTTKFGGFYVNTGTLHFRLTSDPEGSSHPKPSEPTKVSSGNILDTERIASHLVGLTFAKFQKRKHNPGQEKPKKKVRKVGGVKTDEDPRAR